MEIVQIDAFATRPFEGNPSAVCVLNEFPRDDVMQDIASEMNLSETAFIVGRERGAFDLRWFTPAAEVELCGHATLASAHHLWESGVVPNEREIGFDTLSGRLTVTREDGWIVMDFPALQASKTDAPKMLARALGVSPVFVGFNGMDWLVEVDTPNIVRSVKPDFASLLSIGNRGVMVTSPGDSGFDYVARFFAPAFGIPEDPVTGSAHCCMAPYWGAKLGKSDMTAFQASARGGVVRTRLKGERVDVIGKAVTVMQGRLLLQQELT